VRNKMGNKQGRRCFFLTACGLLCLVAGTVTARLSSSLQRKSGAAEIWFLDRAGFAVQTQKRLLLFDYYNAKPVSPDGKGFSAGVVETSEIKKQPVWMFISHEHDDHFNPEIVRTLAAELPDFRCITTKEVAEELAKKQMNVKHLTVVSPHENKRIGDVQVRTLRSTDAGVAFLLTVDGLTLYHAGDHAWWGAEFEAPFKSEIDTLKDTKIDLALLTVDRRLTKSDFAGALYIVRTLQPKAVLPMHGIGTGAFGEGIAFVEAVERLGLPVTPGKITARGTRFFYQGGKLGQSEPANQKVALTARNRPALAYDGARKQILLFGGAAKTKSAPDVWE
jgi:L-ascorbate metabolism protein UlaG (beta-lactamase superfamily)